MPSSDDYLKSRITVPGIQDKENLEHENKESRSLK